MISISNRREQFVCFSGDIFFLFFSLWLALTIRHFSFPEKSFFIDHILPFSFLSLIWLVVFYVYGLYDKQTAVSRKKLPGLIFNAQIINSVIGVFFFYFFPFFGITPKTNLLIYILVSSVLIILWRLSAVKFFKFGKKQNAVILLSEPETKEIAEEIKSNKKYNIEIISLIDVETKQEINFEEEIKEKISQDVSLVIANFRNEKVQYFSSFFYNLFFSGVIFMDAQKIYEELFDKIPLSIIKHDWFLENIYFQHTAYDLIKRVIDIVIALPLAFLSLVLYPFIFVAVKIDDGGSLFIAQKRLGQRGAKIKIFKFRSMKVSDGGVWVKEQDERITKVGGFLRKSRLDEIPQLWNVIKGDISLIGPRPDIMGLKSKLEEEIPYYNARNLIRPGLSGWAQIKQENPPQSIEETKKRLMYDLYYIKNRSLLLDLKIALRTIRILISRTGV